MPEITVVLATQRTSLRRALVAYLRGLPDVESVVACTSIGEILSILETDRPHILLLDGDLVDDPAPMPLFSYFSQIQGQSPETQIIVLEDSCVQGDLFVTAGATQIFHKGQLDQRLALAIQWCAPGPAD